MTTTTPSNLILSVPGPASVSQVLALSKKEITDKLTELGVSWEQGSTKAFLQEVLLEACGLIPSNSAPSEEALDADFVRELPKILGLIPKFEDKSPENFFSSLERMAEIYGWKSSNFYLLLQHSLSGKALEIFLSLPLLQAKNYSFCKERILSSYMRSPDYYVRRFKQSKRFGSESYLLFLQRKTKELETWLSSAKCNNFSDLKSLILKDVFYSLMSPRDREFVAGLPQGSLLNVATALDDKELALQLGQNQQQQQQRQQHPQQQQPQQQQRQQHSQQQQRQPQPTQDTKANMAKYGTAGNRNNLYCNFCKKNGHTEDRCFAKKDTKEKGKK